MNTPQSEPRLIICQCQQCSGGIEFDSRQVGETIACPNCGLETQLVKLVAPPRLLRTPQLPMWVGSEASIVEIQLVSGAMIKAKSVRLYKAAELNELAVQKAHAAELLSGVSSPYRAFGDPLWVIFCSKITSILEEQKSNAAAQKGYELIERIAERERKLRADVKFFPIGQIWEIENPVPSLWAVLLPGERFVHSEEDFVTLTDTQGAVKKVRWACVESYDYQANM